MIFVMQISGDCGKLSAWL